MKGLTICQPYAHLIALPGTDPRAKRVENRGWYTGYRGTLLIHAGKSLAWIEINSDGTADADYGIKIADMAFGAIVAVASLVDCLNSTDGPAYRRGLTAFPWLSAHKHAEHGMFWWVLQDVRPLAVPLPCKGAQGLWTPSEEILAESVRRAND